MVIVFIQSFRYSLPIVICILIWKSTLCVWLSHRESTQLLNNTTMNNATPPITMIENKIYNHIFTQTIEGNCSNNSPSVGEPWATFLLCRIPVLFHTRHTKPPFSPDATPHMSNTVYRQLTVLPVSGSGWYPAYGDFTWRVRTNANEQSRN